jgi:6-pyruvoyltetrahydropterin/6-carboxytetrahydropterin synthase
MSYRITKTYGHDLGLSACFRQHRASSHCQFFHGYALSFKFTFESDELDECGWVLNFGGLKPLKQWLCDTFDHKLLVATDDPALDRILSLADGRGVWNTPPLAQVEVIDAVGCEAFAKLAWDEATALLRVWSTREVAPLTNGVRLVEVEVREHGANSAIYTGEN